MYHRTVKVTYCRGMLDQGASLDDDAQVVFKRRPGFAEATTVAKGTKTINLIKECEVMQEAEKQALENRGDSSSDSAMTSAQEKMKKWARIMIDCVATDNKWHVERKERFIHYCLKDE